MRLVILAVLLAGGAVAGSRTIRVAGDATVESVPDYAVVVVSVESRDRMLKRARTTHEADVAAVQQIASRHKIDASSVAKDLPEIETRAEGYTVRRSVQLKVRDLTSFADLLFDLYDGAAITVDSVEFRVNDLRKLRNQARDMALLAAKEKVDLMVAAMERRVGRVMDVRVETGGGHLLRRRGQTVGDSGREGISQMVAVEPGGNTTARGLLRVPVTARVDVEYEILE